MRTMNVSLTDELGDLVDRLVGEGRFASHSELVREALRAYEEAEDARRLEWLKTRFAEPTREDQLLDGEAVFDALKRRAGNNAA